MINPYKPRPRLQYEWRKRNANAPHRVHVWRGMNYWWTECSRGWCHWHDSQASALNDAIQHVDSKTAFLVCPYWESA